MFKGLITCLVIQYIFNQNIGDWDISSMIAAEKMFQNVTLSTVNYDEILKGWSTLLETESKIPMNIIIDFGNSVYSVCGGGNIAREKLIQEYNWTIQDGGIPHLGCNKKLQFIF